MVAPAKPRKVRMNGKQSFWLVPTIANIQAPTVAEINAVTGINLSCTLLKSFAGLQPTFRKTTPDAYLCETDSYEQNDGIGWAMSDLAGGFDPQADDDSDDKVGFEFLRDGYTGFAVFRNGIVANTTSPQAVAGQFFNVAPVDIQRAVDTSDPTSDTGIATWMAGASVTGEVAINVAAVTGS